MVLINVIGLIKRILLFVAITLMFSCEQLQTLTAKCTECTTEAPADVYIKIKLETNSNPIVVDIYEGNLEDSVLFETFTTFEKLAFRLVPINKNYTLTAKYYYDGSYYVAVNTVSPRLLFEEKLCDEPCYIVYNDVVNLRLKYK